MLEKTIFLEDIEPIALFGANNNNLESIKDHFPKLKIIGRGHEIKAYGSKIEIDRFEKKIELFVTFYHRYHKLSQQDIDQMLEDETHGTGNQADPEFLLYGNHGKIVKARTPNQHKLVKEASHNDLIFAIGPAGTGKTYTAIALAVKALKDKEIRKIILTRPAVEAGEQLGFLPGDMKEKLDPYLQPLYDALNDMLPSKKLAGYMEDNTIQIAPLAYMRGRTLSNAYVILDEAQNTTRNQLKMFLTRMGENAKFIVTGDLTQIDLPKERTSGLDNSLRLLKDIKGISQVFFDKKDIVRHKLVQHIVNAYENEQNNG
jgi:phosphate starvation-inducible protein PhoH and related proteins